MFVSFEGIEGSSKSTQTALLGEWLDNKGVKHTLTKEPGTIISKECQQIRKLILDPENDIVPKTEFFLYLADRAQHVEQVIQPKLNDNEWVITDRYLDSTKVYQGIGRNLGIENIAPMIEYASCGLMPDLTFVMDLPAEVGIERARSSNTEFEGGDRMEREHINFHTRLREGFLELAKTHERYVVLDATQPIDKLHEMVVTVVKAYAIMKGVCNEGIY